MTVGARGVHHHAPHRWAFPAILVANIVLAFGALFVRWADTGPVASGFWRITLAVPILFLLARWQKQKLTGFPRGVWLLLLAGGLFFASDLGAWHIGIMKTKLANAVLFGNASSLLLVLWGIIVLRHRPGLWQSIAILLAFLGGALIMGKSFEASHENLIGDGFSLYAGIAYTAYMLILGRARGTMGSWSVLAWSSAACVIPLLLVAHFMGEKIWPDAWWPLVLLALSSQVIGQGLLIYALPHLSPLIVGLSLLVQPAIAALAGWMLFDERLGVLDFTGMILLAAAMVLIRAVPKARAPLPDEPENA